MRGNAFFEEMYRIARERARKAHSRNVFVRQCCDQTIERLTREKREIEAATID